MKNMRYKGIDSNVVVRFVDSLDGALLVTGFYWEAILTLTVNLIFYEPAARIDSRVC